jgi:pyrroloquinoline quinone biosynthesis protein E
MAGAPLSLIVELTHRCPLHCVYCSNPLEMQARKDEVDTATWKRVFDEAAQLGVLQLNLTGGEPTLREDLAELIEHGRKAKLYSNVITSAVGLTEDKLKQYADAGLDHIQLSIQDAQTGPANEYAGTKAHALKLKAAEMIKKFNMAFTMNMVIHRQNISRLEEMIELAVGLGADRLEIAHVQYYGWAFKNRAMLLPTSEQVKKSMEIIYAAQERLKGKVRIDFATPDYFAKFPKPCMGGWGATALLIDPAGRVMPCHSAMVIPGMTFENVRDRSLSEIWEKSEAFNRFRGDSWMKEPCSSCDRKTKDFGGCRCQAFLVTGDERVADPVCSLAPGRAQVNELISAPELAPHQAWTYRKMKDGTT